VDLWFALISSPVAAHCASQSQIWMPGTFGAAVCAMAASCIHDTVCRPVATTCRRQRQRHLLVLISNRVFSCLPPAAVQSHAL